MGTLLPPLIDPQLGLDASTSRAVMKGAWDRWMRRRSNAVLYGFGLVALLFAYMFVPKLIEPMLGGHRSWMSLAWLGVYVVCIFGLMVLFRNTGLARCVYAELRSRGRDVCPRCGYCLENLPTDRDRCPECGKDRELA